MRTRATILGLAMLVGLTSLPALPAAATVTPAVNASWFAYPPGFRGFFRDFPREPGRINRMNHVAYRRHVLAFIALQTPDEMPLNFRRRCRCFHGEIRRSYGSLHLVDCSRYASVFGFFCEQFFGNPGFIAEFLRVIFTKNGNSRANSGNHNVGGLRFRHGKNADFLRMARGDAGGLGDAVADIMPVLGKLGS